VSREAPSGAIQLDDEHPTRNRKVKYSNLSSGAQHHCHVTICLSCCSINDYCLRGGDGSRQQRAWGQAAQQQDPPGSPGCASAGQDLLGQPAVLRTPTGRAVSAIGDTPAATEGHDCFGHMILVNVHTCWYAKVTTRIWVRRLDERNPRRRAATPGPTLGGTRPRRPGLRPAQLLTSDAPVAERLRSTRYELMTVPWAAADFE
jgi:hypothetical protein